MAVRVVALTLPLRGAPQGKNVWLLVDAPVVTLTLPR
jgi:hypothetical protein